MAADHTFEAVGIETTINRAIGILGKDGEAILSSMSHPVLETTIPPLSLVIREQAERGIWHGASQPVQDLPKLTDLNRSGPLRLDMRMDPQPLDQVDRASDGSGRRQVWSHPADFLAAIQTWMVPYTTLFQHRHQSQPRSAAATAVEMRGPTSGMLIRRWQLASF